MEEEHVMDHGQADNLRRSAEESLERSASREAGIVFGVSCANGANESEELRPKENREAVY
jgi:hypothetical protein